MSFWQFLGNLAASDEGKTIQRVSENTSISTDGTVYAKMGKVTTGSDGLIYTQMGSFSTDGSTRMGGGATGIGAVFNDRPHHDSDWNSAPGLEKDQF